MTYSVEETREKNRFEKGVDDTRDLPSTRVNNARHCLISIGFGLGQHKCTGLLRSLLSALYVYL